MSIKPNWNDVALEIGNELGPEDLDIEWTKTCDRWLNSVVSHYGSGYRVEKSSNFAIMSNQSARYIQVFSSFLEKTLSRILAALDGVASDNGYGKHVAIIFQDIDQYYDYVGMFYPDEGEFGGSSGMYINEGYGHFVFPSQDISFAEPIAVHELTHACLSHLPLPLWLNEGIAVLMEEVLAGNGLLIDNELVARHQEYWNEKTIQEFWAGGSFQAIDEGQELSYHLAHIMVRNISQDFSVFAKFVNNASYEDAGEVAALKNLGMSLEQLVGSFLGDGDWKVKAGA